MSWRKRVLVVANETALSGELLAALQAQAANHPTEFAVVVPATATGGGRAAARERLAAALERMLEAGLVVDGQLGDCDALVAVSEAWDPKRFDEIVVCTLPMRLSKWLHAGLPQRIGELTGAPVTHVIAEPVTAPRPVQLIQRAEEPHLGMLSPLAALGWRLRNDRDRAHPSL